MVHFVHPVTIQLWIKRAFYGVTWMVAGEIGLLNTSPIRREPTTGRIVRRRWSA